MKKKPYRLEILWSTWDLTETPITEMEKQLIEAYGEFFILVKYELEGDPDAKPVSFQIWDKEDNPVFPIELASAQEGGI